MSGVVEKKRPTLTQRAIFAMIFRLSLVLGIGYGLIDTYRTYEAWNADRIFALLHKTRMDCAAKLPDDWLLKNQNEHGNIDVSSICGPGEDGKTFFTNVGEIRNARAGEDMFDYLRGRKPYDVGASAFAFFSAVILVNLIGAVLVGLYRVARWVTFG